MVMNTYQEENSDFYLNTYDNISNTGLRLTELTKIKTAESTSMSLSALRTS